MLEEECDGDGGGGEMPASFLVSSRCGCSKLSYKFTMKLKLINKSYCATHTKFPIESRGK